MLLLCCILLIGTSLTLGGQVVQRENYAITIDDDGLTTKIDIIRLDLSSLDLKTVSQRMFDNFPNLKSLNLANNSLQYLPKLRLANLEHLDISRNPLRLGQFYNGFPSLKILDISYIDNNESPASNFFGLSNSTEIRIGKRQWQYISGAVFENPSKVAWRPSEEAIKRGIKIPEIKLCMEVNHVRLVTNVKENEELEEDCRKLKYEGGEELELSNLGIKTFSRGWYQIHNVHITGVNLGLNKITEIQTELLSSLPPEVIDVAVFANSIEGWSCDWGDMKLLNGSIQLSDNLLKSTKILTSLPASIRTLSLAYNKISEISAGHFARFENLHRLDLSSNRLEDATTRLLNETYSIGETKKARITLLSELPSLRVLDLSNNNLSDIRVLDLLPKGILSLSLSRNRFTKISETGRESIASLAKLRRLDLSYNYLTSIGSGLFEKLTSLGSLHLNSNRLSRLSEKAFSGLRNIYDINLGSNLLVSIEQGTFRLPMLESLNLNENLLDITSTFEIVRGNTLDSLWLSGSNINSIDQLLMPEYCIGISQENDADCSRSLNFRNLTFLDFNSNNIAEVEEHTFDYFPSLDTLFLRNNSLSNLQSGLFEPLKSLRILDLALNKISKLDNRVFFGLNNIRMIDLSYNQLESITSGTFIEMKKLETLNLGNNRIAKLTAGNFIKVPTSTLYLSRNGILEIERGSFNLPSLQRLFLGNNNLTKIGNSFQGLDQLQSLDLPYNRIGTIEKGDFQNIYSRLQWLDLFGNPIQVLQNGALFGLSKTADTIIRIGTDDYYQTKIMGGVFDDY